MKVFGGNAFWQRYEMQSRGMIHTHGFLWLKDFEDI